MVGRATLGLAVGIAVLAMIAREHVLLQLLLAIFAVFLVLWGRAERRTEDFIDWLPGGSYLRKGLNQIDLIISPEIRNMTSILKLLLSGMTMT